MSDLDRIDLAHAADFTLGPLAVRPSTREIVRDGTIEVLEPRVMQVLVALTRADGAIVSRDDLITSCWEGRIVGEDAINRVLSRLRRVADGIGQGSFRIETITKVGYRLTGAEGLVGNATKRKPAKLFGRRAAVAALAVGAAAAVGAGGYWLVRRGRTEDDPQLATLMSQAMLALRQDSREGQNQALGLYRRAVTLRPDNASAWGGLAAAYAYTARWSPAENAAVSRTRAREAIERSVTLDPDNVYAAVARAIVEPLRGHWLTSDRALNAILADHPGDELATYALAELLCIVGRSREGANLYAGLRRKGTLNPGLYYREIQALAATNQIEETDRLLQEAVQIYPTQYTIWFTNVYFLMYTGRASTAIGIIEDVDGRPSGIPEQNFTDILLTARAIADRRPADIQQVVDVWLKRAHEGAGFAENAALFCGALGRFDETFAILDAYYFHRGFRVPDIRFTSGQGSYSPPAERKTEFLFNRALHDLRKDPRFDRLTAELGLKDYWAKSGKKPDYLSA